MTRYSSVYQPFTSPLRARSTFSCAWAASSPLRRAQVRPRALPASFAPFVLFMRYVLPPAPQHAQEAEKASLKSARK